MPEINFNKGDKKMTSFEVIKQIGTIIVVSSIFDSLLIYYSLEAGGYQVGDGISGMTSIFTIIPLIVCGFPLTLIIMLFIKQVIMHFMGTGKYVISSKNEIILRTPRSGLKKTSRVSSLSKIITNPMAKMMMKEADKDGDGRISFDELTEMSFDDLTINERPWNWDFKMAYEKISKQFDLPSNNSPISFDDFSVYTDSEDRTNFDEIDIDNDGFITKEQFVDYFWELGKSEFIELRMVFDKYDLDGDGYLSLEELSTLMASNPDGNWAEEKINNWWSNDGN
mgnify:CR=1 FL=1